MPKPKGNDLKLWCQRWSRADHTEKQQMAQEAGISYETARHWYSDASDEYKEAIQPTMRLTIDDLLGKGSQGVNLDFVSFDIETSNFEADFSIILSAVIKPFGGAPIVFRSDDYPFWTAERSNDKAITVDIAQELRKHAIVLSHYGARFDIQYLRAKMLMHNLELLPPMFGVDTWQIAVKNFKVSSRRLANLGNIVNLGEKHAVEGKLWMAAAYSGSRAAMDEIVQHNIVDVELLEKLGCKIFPYIKSIPKL